MLKSSEMNSPLVPPLNSRLIDPWCTWMSVGCLKFNKSAPGLGVPHPQSSPSSVHIMVALGSALMPQFLLYPTCNPALNSTTPSPFLHPLTPMKQPLCSPGHCNIPVDLPPAFTLLPTPWSSLLREERDLPSYEVRSYNFGNLPLALYHN